MELNFDAAAMPAGSVRRGSSVRRDQRSDIVFDDCELHSRAVVLIALGICAGEHGETVALIAFERERKIECAIGAAHAAHAQGAAFHEQVHRRLSLTAHGDRRFAWCKRVTVGQPAQKARSPPAPSMTTSGAALRQLC
jgi:hypothetical protein